MTGLAISHQNSLQPFEIYSEAGESIHFCLYFTYFSLLRCEILHDILLLEVHQYRDQTWFSMHLRLPGPEGDVENRGRRPRISTSPEGPGKR